MEPNKQAINEGIMEIPKEAIKLPSDQYNISSGNEEVLILEICKGQLTKESVVDCLAVQQSNLIHKSRFNVDDILGCIALTMLIVVGCSIANWLTGKFTRD